MGSIKRKWDSDYNYEEQVNPSASADLSNRQQNMLANTPGQTPWQGNPNNHVQQLLAQAQAAGLLPPSNGHGFVVPSYGMNTPGVPPSQVNGGVYGGLDGRVLPRYNQGADPRLQNYANSQNESDPKRRKLNNNNSSNNKKSPNKKPLQQAR